MNLQDNDDGRTLQFHSWSWPSIAEILTPRTSKMEIPLPALSPIPLDLKIFVGGSIPANLQPMVAVRGNNSGGAQHWQGVVVVHIFFFWCSIFSSSDRSRVKIKSYRSKYFSHPIKHMVGSGFIKVLKMLFKGVVLRWTTFTLTWLAELLLFLILLL